MNLCEFALHYSQLTHAQATTAAVAVSASCTSARRHAVSVRRVTSATAVNSTSTVTRSCVWMESTVKMAAFACKYTQQAYMYVVMLPEFFVLHYHDCTVYLLE